MCKPLELVVLGGVSLISFSLNVALAGATIYLAVDAARKASKEGMSL